MPYEFTMTRRVEFAETDMAGIMHFANFFRWMEATEHAFVRSLGTSVHEQSDETMAGWPRADVSCRYLAPLRYEDEVEIRLLVRARSERSVTYDFVFRRVDADTPAAHGRITAVHATKARGEDRMRAARIPETLAAALEVAPAAVLDEIAPDRKDPGA
jgi:YbgC/YbaW family acyl-CoA thioester hydrolase